MGSRNLIDVKLISVTCAAVQHTNDEAAHFGGFTLGKIQGDFQGSFNPS